jgi:SAM-dependent methyltransferase
MGKIFNAYSAYYDLLYQGKDYLKEVTYVVKILEKFGNGGKQILELGSGTGGHGLVLKDFGFSVYGIELSSEMVKQAQNSGLPCEVADITQFKLDKQFDAVISLFHVISYLTTNQQLLAVFRNAHDHLLPGGLFVFDVWFTPAVLSQKPQLKVREVDTNTLHLIRYASPVIHWVKNVVDVNFRILVTDKVTLETKEIQETHPMRHLSVPEVELMALSTGFKLLLTEEFGSGAVPTEKTWGVCFVLRKQ